MARPAQSANSNAQVLPANWLHGKHLATKAHPQGLQQSLQHSWTAGCSPHKSFHRSHRGLVLCAQLVQGGPHSTGHMVSTREQILSAALTPTTGCRRLHLRLAGTCQALIAWAGISCSQKSDSLWHVGRFPFLNINFITVLSHQQMQDG